MPRVVLRVTHAPQPMFRRGGGGHFIPIGETVEVAAETEEELLVKLSSYAHCCRELVDGEIPKIPHPFLGGVRKVIRKVKAALGIDPDPLASVKPEPAAKPDVWVCPWGGERFAAIEGLIIHFRNAHAEEFPEDVSDEALQEFAAVAQSDPEASFSGPEPERDLPSIYDIILQLVREGGSKTAIRKSVGGSEDWTYREFDEAWDELMTAGRVVQVDRGEYRVEG